MASSPEHAYTPVSGEAESSQDPSPGSSAPASRSGSRAPKKSARIHWQSEGESMDTKKQKSKFSVRDHSLLPAEEPAKPLPRDGRRDSTHSRSRSRSPMARSRISQEVAETLKKSPIPKPSVLKRSSSDVSEKDVNGLDGVAEETDYNNLDQHSFGKVIAERTALSKAQRLSRDLGIKSAPGSQLPSPAISPPPSPCSSDQPPLNLEDIPLERLTTRRQKYGIEDDTESEESDDAQSHKKKRNRFHNAARRLIRRHTGKDTRHHLFRVPAAASSQTSLRSGQVTPQYERDHEDYVARPKAYNEGILSSLLRLYNDQDTGAAKSSHLIQNFSRRLSASKETSFKIGDKQAAEASSGAVTPTTSKAASGQATPKHQKWYYKDPSPSATPSVANLVSSSRMLAQPTAAPLTEAEESAPPVQGKKAGMRPQPTRKGSSQTLFTLFGMAKAPKASDDEFKVHVHIADVLKRHQYLLKLCKALMSYGAPTHRLEEYMRMSARVLEVEGQFLYIPGCMIISFDDSGTHTTEVRIVRTAQGVHLGKLRDAHEIYKEVVHDRIDLDEAMARLDQVVKAKDVFPPWFLVGVYGLASACVGPFAFGARPIDLPIAFFLGCLLGIMQLIIAPKSELYSNIFEITAAVLTSFLARAFGSIRNGELFCFSALAQSSIALILPGYIVLCGSLELQSRSIVAGSVRMVYAVIYSLFLGFGITIGTSFYGGISSRATSDIVCRTQNPPWYPFIFVPPFTLCLIVINQGKFKQMPVMLFIAFTGYVVNHFSAARFKSNAQVANTLGAVAVGVLGNLYSRLRHGLAAAALLPAIFVQVPSGLAASGSLVSGVTSANQITNQTVNGTRPHGGDWDHGGVVFECVVCVPVWEEEEWVV
ncbi:MAG: hypothetical protein Q9195_003195 [Heterodermia aff. obscurata]